MNDEEIFCRSCSWPFTVTVSISLSHMVTKSYFQVTTPIWRTWPLKPYPRWRDTRTPLETRPIYCTRLPVRLDDNLPVFPSAFNNSSRLHWFLTETGGSDDWAKGVAGIKYSYTVELAPSSTGGGGFILPARQIQSVCDDFFPAVQSFGEQIINLIV